MADPLCAECAKPILPTDDNWTVEQVDACTMVVERVTYHSACRDRKTAQTEAPSARPPRGEK